MWFCPACKETLEQQQNTWRCVNGHSYDRSKEGYVNLLLAQHKNSREPGDNKQMINARRAFLEKGYYQPLAVEIAKLVDKYATSSALKLFDAGCGEGYYCQQVRDYLTSQGIQVISGGCDISKIAIQKAAKKYPESEFCVASTFNLPLANASQNTVFQVFAPSSHDEIERVLEDEGIWIQVDPAANHLQELKSKIYQKGQEHKPRETEIKGFDLLENQTLEFIVSFEVPEDVLHLLMMTPFYWSTMQQQKEQLESSLNQVTAAFSIRVFRKSAGGDE